MVFDVLCVRHNKQPIPHGRLLRSMLHCSFMLFHLRYIFDLIKSFHHEDVYSKFLQERWACISPITSVTFSNLYMVSGFSFCPFPRVH